jgi:hypothetical protein
VIALRNQGTKVGIALAWLLWLPAVWGCSHGSAASPAADAVKADTAENPRSETASSARDDSSPPKHEVAENASSASTDNSPTAADHAATDSLPPLPAGQRPPADRTPARPGQAEKITFEDLNLGMEADMVFRPFMLLASERVKELEGKRISIVGYMHPPESQRGIKQFILLKNTQCKFGPGGQADHLADIHLRNGQSTKYTPSPLKVEGTLKIEPFEGPDGNTWSIYRLEDAQIH